MNAKYLGVLALAFTVVIACQKEPSPDPPVLQKKSTPDYWSAANNPNNPYEYLAIGVYHNNCLEYFRDSRNNYQTRQAWIEDRFQITLDFFCIGSDTLYCDGAVSLNALTSIDSIALNDSLFTYELDKLPPPLRDNINKLLGFYDQFTMDQYTLFKAQIVEFEKQADTCTLLSPSDHQLILIASQVARYSALYWKSQIAQSFSGWDLPNYQKVEWAATSKSDVRGSIIGFIAGKPDESSLGMSVKGGSVSSSSGATAATQSWQ